MLHYSTGGRKRVKMREFIPSDYIDKEGNVYETVGENIREGKNGDVVDYVISKLPYLQNAKTGIVTFSISETGSASIVENEANLNIYTETDTNTLRILCRENKNIIDLKILKCTTDSASNFDITVNTFFSVNKNSLYKVINITNIKTITLFLSVEV